MIEEKRVENNRVTTTKELAEYFIPKEEWDSMTPQQKSEANQKQIKKMNGALLCYPKIDTGKII